jgi:hypothetical protein
VCLNLFAPYVVILFPSFKEVYFSTLNMQAAGSSETLEPVYKNTLLHLPDYASLDVLNREKLNSHIS